jgi:hypothetical protein
METDKITEGDEVNFPTFELASNDQFDTTKPGWPWVGNFARLSQWEGVKHFTKKSFLLWRKKKALHSSSTEKIRNMYLCYMEKHIGSNQDSMKKKI